MLPNLELSARFQTQESVLNLGVFCLWNTTVCLTFFSRRRPVKAGHSANKDRPEAARYKGRALSWQGFGSSRAAGVAALITSDIESGDSVSGLVFPPSASVVAANGPT
jgi:hypothetical protein